MMHDQGMPLHLRAKACNTSVYLQNRSPHCILGMKTPEEAFSGKRLDVGHFRIFGSLVYCHVTKDAWKKLEPTTKLVIFVGYTYTSKLLGVHVDHLDDNGSQGYQVR